MAMLTDEDDKLKTLQAGQASAIAARDKIQKQRALAMVGAAPLAKKPVSQIAAPPPAAAKPVPAAVAAPTQPSVRPVAQPPAGTAAQPTSSPTVTRQGYTSIGGQQRTAPAGIAVRMGRNGVPEFSNAPTTQEGAATAAAAPASVTPTLAPSQAFSPAITARRPQVASTFGMPVTDPRINDQMRPAPSSNAVPSGASLRGADQMAEHYNSRENREAIGKTLSNLRSQQFRLEMAANRPGRAGRAALDALQNNAAQQAGLLAGQGKQDAEAIQNRAQRENVLANTNLEQQGNDRRNDANLASALGLETMRQQGENNRSAATLSSAESLEKLRQQGETERYAMRPQAGQGFTADGIGKMYSDQRTAIQNSPYFQNEEDRAAALEAHDASPLGQRYAQLMGAGVGGGSSAADMSYEDYVKAGQAEGIKATPEEWRAEYNKWLNKYKQAAK